MRKNEKKVKRKKKSFSTIEKKAKINNETQFPINLMLNYEIEKNNQ
jgi:hypothetical protein